MHRRTPPPTMTSYRGYLPIKMLLYIAMTHAWAYPPMTSYRGVPVNHNVTIYSDDSFMGVPPFPTIRSYRGYLSIKMLL